MSRSGQSAWTDIGLAVTCSLELDYFLVTIARSRRKADRAHIVYCVRVDIPQIPSHTATVWRESEHTGISDQNCDSR
jgi:hypothetical protein